MIITFNELRELKAALPDGAMHRIAEELNVDVDTVRNYFGGTNFDEGLSTGLHLEAGPNGGLCCVLTIQQYMTRLFRFWPNTASDFAVNIQMFLGNFHIHF